MSPACTLDLDETPLFPGHSAGLDLRREKRRELSEEDGQTSFHHHRDCSLAQDVPWDSASGRGAGRRLVCVPTAMVHGHLPKGDDEWDRLLSQFRLRDKHARRYDALHGFPITSFVRVGGVRCSTHHPSTVSLSGRAAWSRPITG